MTDPNPPPAGFRQRRHRFRRSPRVAGEVQPLEPKAFAVLALLAGASGRAFSRDDILDVVPRAALRRREQRLDEC